MIDFVLGLALAAMLVRGWMRGFVRETLDLVGLVLGLFLAFRLSAPLGDFFSESFGLGPEAGRIGGGILLFILFGAVLSIAAHYLSKVMNLPGLSLINRVGGAAIAVGWGVVIVLVLVSLIEVLPISSDWRDEIDESNVVGLIAGEEALPRQLFVSLAGDNVLTAIAALRELFGSSRVVPQGDEVVEIPPAAADETRQVRAEAERLLAAINEDRVGASLRAVRSVTALTQLAEDHAEAQYTSGRIRRMQNCMSRLADRSYQVVRCDNGVGLAGTSMGAYQGIYDSPEGKAMVEAPDFDRVGVAVVEGPTGRLVVVVLGG